MGNNSSIDIGNECLFSNNITICTTDFHTVVNSKGEKTNPDKDIKIGEHVWIGRNAYIGKGVTIAQNSIVGANSVVTKSFSQENILIAGNPAKICKEDINWKK